MTLIVSMQYENKIVIAADGMAYMPASGGANIPYATEKIHTVSGTNWILTFSGWAGVEVSKIMLAAEASDNPALAFDPRLEIGGPAYLSALRQKSKEAGVPKNAHAAIAGFDGDGRPLVLSSLLPQGATYKLPEISALGIQEATAIWLMRTLLPACTCIEDVKRLAYFTITQVAKQELSVGHPDRYTISLAVMENGKPTLHEGKMYADLADWFGLWEDGLRRCFMTIIAEEQTDDRR